MDETCDSGDTMRLAVSAVNEAGASEIRTAVSIRTGGYAPDFHAIATESTIILPWDREILVDGELRPNPLYADALGERVISKGCSVWPHRRKGLRGTRGVGGTRGSYSFVNFAREIREAPDALRSGC